MKPNPILVFRIGYMERYDSKGEIRNGGAHIVANGEGGEMWNFREEAGRCYGYVMTKHFSGINLSRIFPERKWRENDEIDGVDIFFISKKDGLGQVVVGWYKDATVFHKKYRGRRGNPQQADWTTIDYVCEADAAKTVLLSEEERTFIIQTGEKKGMPGQSNVWYADSDTIQARQLIANLRKLAYGDQGSTKKKASPKLPLRQGVDTEHILKVEIAAITEAIRFYTGFGYRVVSYEKDNLGWDLEAEKAGEKLLLEVKGHSGNTVQFELTPNEYAKLKEHRVNYRVCVVRRALVAPDLRIFKPVEKDGHWILEAEDSNEKIFLTEKVAAKASSYFE